MPIAQRTLASCFGVNDGTITVTVVGQPSTAFKFILAKPNPLLSPIEQRDPLKAIGVDSAVAVGQYTFTRLVGADNGQQYIWMVKDPNTNNYCTIATVPDPYTLTLPGRVFGYISVEQPRPRLPLLVDASNMGLYPEVVSPACAGESTGSITVAIENGLLTGYRFTLYDENLRVIESKPIKDQSIAQYTFKNLSGGDVTGGKKGKLYRWRIEDLISPSCVRSGDVYLADPDPIRPAVNPAYDRTRDYKDQYITNVTRLGGNDGAITPTIAGGKAPYKYYWSKNNDPSPFSISKDISGLTADAYKLVVVDANGCDTSFIFNVNQPRKLSIMLENPDVPGDFNATNILCNGGKGKVRVVALGGRGGKIPVNGMVQSQWPDAGKYFQLERNGVILFANTFMPVNNPLVSTYSTKDTVRTSILYEGLPSGDYTVKSWDVLNEIDPNNMLPLRNSLSYAEYKFTILEPAAFTINYVVDSLDCYYDKDAGIYLSVSGGVPPYSYTWSELDINGFPITTKDLIGIPAGIYSVTVRDATGKCSTSREINVPYPGSGLPLKAMVATISQPTCYGATNGALLMTAEGGTFHNTKAETLPPVLSYTFQAYDVNWNKIGRVNATNPFLIEGLAAGYTHVVVRDDKGCLDTLDIKRFDVTLKPADVTNLSSADMYGNFNERYVNLTPKTTGDIVLEEDDNDADRLNNRQTIRRVKCYGTATGSVAIRPRRSETALTAPQTFGGMFSQTGPGGFPSTNGSDRFIIKDVDVDKDNIAFAWDDKNYDGAINALDIATFNSTNAYSTFTDEASYIAFFDGTSNNLNGMPVVKSQSEDYNYMISNENGSVLQNVAMFKEWVIADEFGNIPPRADASRFVLQQQVRFDNLVAGNYIVMVNGVNDRCVSTIKVTVPQPAEPLVSYLHADSASCNLGTSVADGGRLWVNTRGGTPFNAKSYKNISLNGKYIYDYQWLQDMRAMQAAACLTPFDNDSLILFNTPALQGCVNQRFGAMIFDAEDCSTLAQRTVARFRQGELNTDTLVYSPRFPLTVSIRKISDVLCNPSNGTAGQGNEGELRAVAVGGTRPYIYKWSHLGKTPGQDSAYKTLGPGPYSVEVIDARGCTARVDILLETPALLNVSITATTPTASCSPRKGTGTVSFRFNGGSLGGQFTTLTGVVDARGKVIDNADLYSIEVDGMRVGGLYNPKQEIVGIYEMMPAAGRPLFDPWTNYTSDFVDGTVTNLGLGDHVVSIVDAVGCRVSKRFTIGSTVTDKVAVVFDTDEDIRPIVVKQKALFGRDTVSCYGISDGAIKVYAVIGFNSSTGTNYDYTWYRADSIQIARGTGLNTISGLAAGEYSVQVTEPQTGCSVLAHYTIYNRNMLTVTPEITDVACYNEKNGAIALTIAGGKPPYKYAFKVDLSDSVKVSGNTATISGLYADKYTFKVWDSNGCQNIQMVDVKQKQPFRVYEDRRPGWFGNVSCNGNADGYRRVRILTSSANFPVHLQWVNADGVTIKETDLASTDAQVDTIIYEPQGHRRDSMITVVADYMSNLAAGSYKAMATDAKGCAYTLGFTVEDRLPLVFNTAGTQITASARCGEKLGQIRVEVSGGRRPYTYKLYDKAGFLIDSSTVASFVTFKAKAGEYYVIANDSADHHNYYPPMMLKRAACVTRLDGIVVTEPTAPVLEVTILKPVSCRDGNDGFAKANASGGGGTKPTFSFEWILNSQPGVIVNTSAAPKNLRAGTYLVTAINQQTNCRSSKLVTIEQPSDSLKTVVEVKNPICNGSNNGTITARVTGGTMPYTYTWYKNPNNLGALTSYQVIKTGSASVLADLAGGVYAVEVNDARGCSWKMFNILVREPEKIFTNNILEVPVSCYQGNDGRFVLTIRGGVPPYNTEWFKVTGSNSTSVPGSKQTDLQPDDSVSVSNLSAGTYRYQIIDSVGCVYAEDRVVVEPQLIRTTETVLNIGCTSGVGNDGSISITQITGGTPFITGSTDPKAYDLTWYDGSKVSEKKNLPAGTYFVTITDKNGCTITKTYNITNSPLTADVSVQNIRCYQTDDAAKDGAIIGTITGGKAPYIVSVTKEGSTSTDVYTFNTLNKGYITKQNLTEGIYNVSIKDSRTPSACVLSTMRLEVKMASSTLSATASVERGPTCRSSKNGKAYVKATGGVSPYTYLWEPSLETKPNAELLPGSIDGTNISVTVIDGYGCRLPISLVVPAPAQELTVSASQRNITTCSGNDGAISVNVEGGVPSYSYTWSNGATTEDLGNVTAGVYTLTVVDNNGCHKTISAEITQPAPLTLAVDVNKPTCYAGSNGSINVTLGNSNNPKFEWSNGATTEDLSGIGAGEYTVRAIDTYTKCVAETTVVVGSPEPIKVSYPPVRIECGASNGNILLEVQGINPPFAFIWSNGATTQVINGLSADVYTVTVTDKIGCTTTMEAEVDINSDLKVAADIKQISCNGQKDAVISLNITGGQAPISVMWENIADTTATISNLGEGTYKAIVTDSRGCVRKRTYKIVDPAVLVASIASQKDVTCGNARDGKIDLNVTGGSKPYSFFWSNEARTEDLTSISGGSYIVTVTDNSGCTATAEASIAEPAALEIDTRVTPVGCSSGSNGAIELTVNGGVSPYTYSWNTGETSANVVNLKPGTYNVIIVDATNCRLERTVTVELENTNHLPTVVFNGDSVLCGSSSATLLIAESGYDSYLWNNGETDASIVVRQPGTYFVTAHNKCGDFKSREVVVRGVASIPKPTVTGPNQDCYITSSVTSAEYSYQWFLGDTLLQGANSYQYRATKSGSYSVRISSKIATQCRQQSEPLYVNVSVSCKGVAVAPITPNALTLYPNPTSDMVSLKGDWRGAQVAKVEVINSLGQVVHSFETDAIKNANVIQFSVSDLATGIYNVRVSTTNFTWSGNVNKR